jgi:hypothetical protein
MSQESEAAARLLPLVAKLRVGYENFAEVARKINEGLEGLQAFVVAITDEVDARLEVVENTLEAAVEDDEPTEKEQLVSKIKDILYKANGHAGMFDRAVWVEEKTIQELKDYLVFYEQAYSDEILAERNKA